MWCHNVDVTLALRIGTTHGPVALVLARAAGLYLAHTGSIPVTGSNKSKRHQSAGANPVAATTQADGRVMFEGTRPDHPSL
jgi:hypothetical protein